MNIQRKLAKWLSVCIVGTITVLSTAKAQAVPVQTRVFSVSKMTCPTCPISVKTAIGRIAGVKQVKVDFERKTATVIYDPAIATPAMISSASAAVGFPAHVAGR